MEASYKFSEKAFEIILKEIEVFWAEIEILQLKHISPNLSIPIDINEDSLSLIDKIEEYLIGLSEINDFLIDELKTSYFDTICVSMPNLLARINTALTQLEIKHLETLVAKDEIFSSRLHKARAKFKEIAQFGGLQ